jgi:hypothetical protein
VQTLAPRQPLSSSAYALRAAVADSAASLSGTVSGAQVTGTLSNVTVPGATPWVAASAATQAAASNTGYVANSPTLTAFTLPATPTVGDVVKVTSQGIGGFTVSPNAGQTIATAWIPREQPRYWYSVASSADGSKLVAVVGGLANLGLVNLGLIYTSTDSGFTWTARDSARVWISVASSADGIKLVAVEKNGHIYISTDSGQNWTARDSVRNWISVASSADGTKLVAVDDGGLIYASLDSGVSWSAREQPRNWWSVASSADGTKLVALVWPGQIYTSTDSGLTWFARDNARPWSSVASSADGTKLVAVVSGGYIYTSVDSGVTWTARESVRNWSSVASSADGSKLVAVVPGGQIFTSLDSGVTWTPQDSARSWYSVASSADGNKLVAGVNGGQIYTWNSIISGGQYATVELVYRGSGLWIRANQQGLGNVNVPPPGVVDFGSYARPMINLYGGGTYGIGVQPYTQYYRIDNLAGPGGFAWYMGGSFSGVADDPGGGITLMHLNRSGTLTTLGAVNPPSDRNIKEAFAQVDARSILAKVVDMPITSWAYKADPQVRHIGPMAQDFYAAFDVGTDEKHIATVDEGGVALAAIQGLYKIVQEKDAQLQSQAEEIADLKKQSEKIGELEKQSAHLARLISQLEKANLLTTLSR